MRHAAALCDFWRNRICARIAGDFTLRRNTGGGRSSVAEASLVRGGTFGGMRLVETTLSYSFVIADDHPLFRGALREALSGLLGRIEVAEAGSFDEVAKILDRGGEADLVLLDLAMPGVRGFSGLMYLRAQARKSVV